MKRFQVQNIYEEKLHMKKPVQSDPLQIVHPSNIMIIGKTGSGKTNLVVNLIRNMGGFEKVYLFTGTDTQEPIYQWMHQQMGNNFEPYQGFSSFYKKMKEIADDKDLADYKTLIICDDFLMSSKKEQDQLAHFSTHARKTNAIAKTSFLLLTQSYFGVPKLIRLNVQYFMLMSGIGKNELKLICQHGGFDLGPNITIDDVDHIYKDATKGKDVTDFFLVDKKTKYENLKFRKQFDNPYITDENESLDYLNNPG